MLLNKIGVVVLNYKNYGVTIESVQLLLNQSIPLNIVIVDNGSGNESFGILQKNFDNYKNVHVIESKENVGFAKGNNIGITYLREKNFDTIALINSDIMIENENFFKILSRIHFPENVATIGPRIISLDGINQNPFYWKNSDFKIYLLLVYLYLRKIGLPKFSHIKKIFLRKSAKKTETNINSKSIFQLDKTHILNNDEYLHGSCFILTPKYFKTYDGLYSQTFLYSEEVILGVLLNKAGMKSEYVSELEVLHLEDQSSAMEFTNTSKQYVSHTIFGLKQILKVRKKDISELIENTK